MDNQNSNEDSKISSIAGSTPEASLDKSKFGTLQVLTAAQVVTLLIKSDTVFAGPCGY